MRGTACSVNFDRSHHVQYFGRMTEPTHDTSRNDGKANRRTTSDPDVGSWDWDLATEEFRLSDELIGMIGLGPKLLPTTFRDMMDLIHPDDVEQVRASVEQALAGESSFHVEHRLIRPDAAVMHLRVLGVVERDAAGGPVRILGLAQDVTNAMRMEAALRMSEHRVRAILSTTVDAIITADERGRIESFNKAAEKLFGYTEAEVIGKNLNVLMPPPYREEHDSYVRNYIETGEAQIIGIGREVEGQRRDGSIFPLELAVSEVQVEGRRIFTGIIKDISDRRRLELEILRISEQEQRRIGQDLHDGLGQMLTGIGLLSQHLARQLRESDHATAAEADEITGLIREADQQARALARGLVPVDIEVEGLATALNRLSKNVQALFGIVCHVRTIGSPAALDASSLTHLFRIAQEAVSNAVKHGQATEVSIALAFSADRIRLRIRDNGVGFSDSKAGNGGMGVPIMLHRARIIGGTLEIRSNPDEGASVTCTVPLTTRTLQQPPP